MKVNDLLLIRMREMMCEECGDNLNLSLVNRIELSANIREVSMFPEKAPTKAFPLLKAPTGTFTIKNLLIHVKLWRLSTKNITDVQFETSRRFDDTSTTGAVTRSWSWTPSPSRARRRSSGGWRRWCPSSCPSSSASSSSLASSATSSWSSSSPSTRTWGTRPTFSSSTSRWGCCWFKIPNS